MWPQLGVILILVPCKREGPVTAGCTGACRTVSCTVILGPFGGYPVDIPLSMGFLRSALKVF